MIVVDTSALISIQFGEADADIFKNVLHSERVAAIGAPTLLEYYMVITGRYGDAGRAEARALTEQLDLKVFNWSDELVDLAIEGFIRFGKGMNRAGLNFGDCMAYALAKALDVPLLFKGDDFALTDVRSAVVAFGKR